MKHYESIPFLTDNGEEVEFFILEQTTVGGSDYLLVEENSGDSDGDELVYIMKKSEEPGADDLASYSFVEDDEELSLVMKIFEQLLDDTDIIPE
ncbi:MAG: DUF1292 domain-containing protein [Eubacterium sp.]|nr:DUF1292 domain-containing protein [Eubacterium sp.]